MPTFALNDNEYLYYEHHKPGISNAQTFVFFNALTGDTNTWETHVAPALRDIGYGTFTFDFRGQNKSRFAPLTQLDESLIVGDAVELLENTRAGRPIFVGLSIGGLFAIKSHFAGVPAEGLVLLNTLRRNNPKLEWINQAIVRCVETGGIELFRDLFCPLLFNNEWLAENRKKFLTESDYQPIDLDSGAYNLLKNSLTTDWNINYSALRLPTLVVTGLQDRVFLNQQDVDELAALIPDCRIENLPDAGHMIPTEKPDKLVNFLVSFAGTF